MNKEILLKTIRKETNRNLFSIGVIENTEGEGTLIQDLAKELDADGKIRLKECNRFEGTVYLEGILKYASE
ncbi:hypothetical protein MZM54_03465 [[Brevibacterium] frigoritolerans]|nr:hypothetical protein [Peribacillus frigoritolerans]